MNYNLSTLIASASLGLSLLAMAVASYAGRTAAAAHRTAAAAHRSAADTHRTASETVAVASYLCRREGTYYGLVLAEEARERTAAEYFGR